MEAPLRAASGGPCPRDPLPAHASGGGHPTDAGRGALALGDLACVDAIAKTIASCQWSVYRPIGKGRRELLEDDPLHWLLNTRPNPEMTAIGFREALLYQAIPGGNAYAEIVRDFGGRVAELWPLESDRVTPRRTESGALLYEYLQPDGTNAWLEPRQVFHLRGPSLTGLMGENLVVRAAKSLGCRGRTSTGGASTMGREYAPACCRRSRTYHRSRPAFNHPRSRPAGRSRTGRRSSRTRSTHR